jgi:hypothetical protein
MKPLEPSPGQSDEKPGIDDKETGLPVLKTWPSVYLFVFVVFVLCVLVLTLLTRAFP